MSSSNKNWPSMFKSKPCNNHRHHRDIDTPSYMHYSNCNISSPFSSDRVPDPKPRWNPKPEQIRILESIFNSGIVNPPRDEIQRIRIRLQEYGQIGDANVFYWFQNRKSRAKHKLRVLQKNPKMSGCNPNKTRKDRIITPSDGTDPCFGLVNQETGLFPAQNNELVITEPAGYIFPVDNDPSVTPSGFGFGDFVVPVVTEEGMEFSAVNNGVPEINFDGGENGYFPNSVPFTVPLTIDPSQGNVILSGGGDTGDGVSPVRLTVFINDMPFEVAAGLFNVKEAFGNDAVLINSFGQPILTDEFGVTFQPLQNGAVYYLACDEFGCSTEEVVTRAVSAARKWEAAQQETNLNLPIRSPDFKPPIPPDAVICNKDVAWNPTTTAAGLGWIFRTPGRITIYGDLAEARVFSPVLAEAMAIRAAFSHAIELDISQIYLQSYAQDVIRAINSGEYIKEIFGILFDIHSLAVYFSVVDPIIAI